MSVRPALSWRPIGRSRAAITARLARRMVADARAMPVNTVARRHGVSWGLVNALVVAWAGLVADHRRRRRCRVLLVDETSIRKRHRYVTVLVNGDTGEVLAMVPHRDAQAALSAFLAAQGHRWCKGVKVVVSDGSKAYKAAIDKPGSATPATCWTGSTSSDGSQAGLVAVRRDVQRRPEGSVPAFDRDVFRSRFLLMRRPDKLAAKPSRPASASCSPPIPGSRRPGTRSPSCTASTLPTDHKGALEALDRFADIYSTGD